MLELGNYYLN